MDCTNLSTFLAEAFTAVFEAGMFYSVIILLAGFALGALVFYRRSA